MSARRRRRSISVLKDVKMKQWKPCLAWMLTIFALALPGISQAQNPGNGGTTYAGLQVTTRPEEFLGKFVELAQADGAANAALLTAMGDAEAAKKVSSQLATLDTNATPADISAATAATRAARQRVTDMLAAHLTLSDASKASIASGALKLANTAHGFTLLTRNINATKQSLSQAGAPARIALLAARATPDQAAQLRAELGAMLSFAGANQLSLAPEVGQAAAEL